MFRPGGLLRKYGLFLVAGLFIGAGLGGLILLGLNTGPDLLRSIRGQAAVSPLVPRLDEPAGDFELITTTGKKIRLSDLRGQAVVLNFWATWCGPCRVEMPLIEEYYQRYAPAMRVLAINYDEPSDQVLSFVNENRLTFDVLLDPETKVADLYRVRGLPTTVFIDQQGVIRYHQIGPLSENQLRQYLQEIGVGG